MGKRLTTAEFIERARKVHGDRYDYSQVEYVNATTKVKIICPTHGLFEQAPTSHFNSTGCPKCGRLKQANSHRYSNEEFESIARQVHGDTYDYSKVQYVSSTKNVVIICPVHGEFTQTPARHLSGSGCIKCAKRYQPTTEEFIEQARQVFGETYDYSQVEYVNANTKVKIICPEHGQFVQKPSNHLRGHGCYKCGRSQSGKSNAIPQDEFIKRANKVHNNKYDYSKVEYVRMHEKVAIICPAHGEFYQTPTGHLSGKGCAKCAKNIKLENEEFISRSRLVHGNKYDYTKVNYVNNHTKVVISCPIHGDFKQSPAKHLSGNGCLKCGRITIGRKKADTQEDFLDKARDIHGDTYDYSMVRYTRSNRKITIICPEHGEFEKTPNKHLLGEGCPKCSGRYRRSAEDFINDARKVHGNKYDYSKSDYRNTKHKVTIICRKHGEFLQAPEGHLAGKGCPKCAGLGITTDEYIQKANKVHSNKYDYSHTKYVRMIDAIKIICPLHGEFTQAAGNHLSGAGCQKCAGNYRMNTADFIDRAKDVHGGKYDYSKSKYVRSADKLTIICPIHGVFKQTPNAHLAGVGCSSCAHYGINTHEPGMLYYIRINTRVHTFWKIGITNYTVERRFRGSDIKNITKIKTWPYKRLYAALKKEQEIINDNFEYLYAGIDQPLQSGGNTELFTRDVLGLDKDYK